MATCTDIVNLCKNEVKTFKQNLPTLIHTKVNATVDKKGHNARVCISFCNTREGQYLKGTSIILVSDNSMTRDLLFLHQFLKSQLQLCKILFWEENN